MAGEDQRKTPHLLLQNGVLLDFGPGATWIVGRATPQTTVDIDLMPHGGTECGVSRQHIRIGKQGDDFTIEDLKSRNETVLNRARLLSGQCYPLVDGDRLFLGALQVIFVLSAQ